MTLGGSLFIVHQSWWVAGVVGCRGWAMQFPCSLHKIWQYGGHTWFMYNDNSNIGHKAIRSVTCLIKKKIKKIIVIIIFLKIKIIYIYIYIYILHLQTSNLTCWGYESGRKWLFGLLLYAFNLDTSTTYIQIKIYLFLKNIIVLVSNYYYFVK